MNKRVTCCVTNDLLTDQRMERICSSLQRAGFQVTLVGRQRPDAGHLPEKSYRQVRLPMWFSKGKAFYLEFNLRLFIYLLFHRTDVLVAIDLDTIVPVYHASRWKKIPRVYDAHELFTELKEVVTRPAVHRFWLGIERRYLPRFPQGYTVSASIARHFKDLYGVDYALIRNMPAGGPDALPIPQREKHFIYQGAVNEGRCFEWLIPAMTMVEAPLLIYGDGNFSGACRDLIKKHGVGHKVKMMGTVTPAQLTEISKRAFAGINLVEPLGLNQRYSLANKFFDYIKAGIPQVTMDFPEYRAIQDQYPVAVLIAEPSPENIAHAMNKIWNDGVFYETTSAECARAAKELRWEKDEQVLVRFYQQLSN